MFRFKGLLLGGAKDVYNLHYLFSLRCIILISLFDVQNIQ